jgi:hypothetical protein
LGQSDPGARFGIDHFISCIAQGMAAAFIINILFITGMTQVALDAAAPAMPTSTVPPGAHPCRYGH